MHYDTFVKALIVVPAGEPIYSEQATTVSIDDEAVGPFVVVEQSGNSEKVDRISIDPTEWPALKAAIETLMAVCHEIGKKDQRSEAHLCPTPGSTATE